ncbi:MAG: HD domain-containing protein [Planctomycetes bacterium]|nr:HD domain-containing protein [Planctomycetota bacterium]
MAHELKEDPLVQVALVFWERGGLCYGESVTQLEHALQCAAFAEAEMASPALVSAALLHDLGHMLHLDAARAYRARIDDRHERIGASFLSTWFGQDVTSPIALHVDAKRYRCHVDPNYRDSLSRQSLVTLELQGGVMTPAEAERFASRPFAADAVRLRRWDDAAKVSNRATPGLEHFLAIAGRCVR